MAFRQRLQVRFAKRGDLRFISHHDLMRLFERACRRADLPLRMSEGFNPRPRFSFPLSMAVGVEGWDEVMEVQLSGWLAPAEVDRRLRAVLPAGLEVVSISAVDPRRTAEVVGVAYRVEHEAIARLAPADLDALMARREVLVTRTRKGRSWEFDLRPYVRRLTLLPVGPGDAAPVLRIETAVTPKGTVRPDEVLAALGIQVSSADIEEAEAPAETGAGAPTRGASETASAAAPHIVRERVQLATAP